MIHWAVALVVFGCMTFEDTLNAVYILAFGNRKRWTAGWADGLEDVAQYVGIGIGGGALRQFGWSVSSALIVAAILAGSQLGAQIGDRVESCLGDRKPRRD